jgi:hypothetical protein
LNNQINFLLETGLAGERDLHFFGPVRKQRIIQKGIAAIVGTSKESTFVVDNSRVVSAFLSSGEAVV